MERIDIYLVNNNIVKTRSKASQLIKENKVLINGKIATKNGVMVNDNDIVKIIDLKPLNYVSRGGLKLAHAIEMFNIDFKDKICVDIGSSTGGFSDCLLQNDAKKVYSIDVGSNQLDSKLKEDNRIVSLENLNFKDVELSMFNEKIDYYVCDVSFISIRQIFNKLLLIDPTFKGVFLFKPQFEVGNSNLNPKGLVKSKKAIIDALNDLIFYLKSNNIILSDITYSNILGNKSGNIEFLLYINNIGAFVNSNIEKLVNEAYKMKENYD